MSTPMWEREGVSAPVAGLRDALRTGRGGVEKGEHLARASRDLEGPGEIAVRRAKTNQFGKGGTAWLSC